MGEVATISGPSKLERFVADVLAGGRREQLMAALPAHIKPERFEREFSNALMQQPELLAYDARLVFREIARVANLGLRMEKDLGEAYLIEAYNYKTKRKEPQVRIGYRGMIKLAKQSGTYTKVYAREVHQSDQYDVLQGTEERLVHRPVLHGERGDVIEYYAVAQLTDGTAEFERMTLDETLAIRDRSDAWKAYQDGKIKSTPWATDEGEMAKKGLALDTPIPTPHGWTTMGELEVGHKVFDKDGDIVDVIAVSEVKSIPCFRVTFSCGDQIVCDDEHRWLDRAGGSHASRHQFSVQTINELHEA
ncbi:MAG: recombinase RecT, partial [Methyloceanibacter sp.]